MAEENEEVQQAEETESPPKTEKGNLKLIVIIAAVCVVVAVGAFVGFKMLGSKGGESGAEYGQTAEHGEGPVGISTMFHLEPFILNLTDHGRYLKVTIELEISNASYKRAVEQKVPQLRDTIITLVGSKSIKAISSPEGKFQLKDELLFRANQIMGMEKDTFKNLYFTEFVMQ